MSLTCLALVTRLTIQGDNNHWKELTSPNIIRCWHPLVDYIEEQFQQFLHAETRINRLGDTLDDNYDDKMEYIDDDNDMENRPDNGGQPGACSPILHLTNRPRAQVDTSRG